MLLKDKKIVLGVTGGIAVFKAAALTSKLVQLGAQVKVIMTESAQKFVTPLTFQALSRNEVYTDTFKESNPTVISHIDLADWPDLILVAPATANSIGKLANGLADDMLTTTLLATTSEVWIAPAMNVHMYDHPSVKRNIKILYEQGYRFIEPSEGNLACGYVGKGRLEEPDTIVKLLGEHFDIDKSLTGKRLLVTAGPTIEKIDPVRYFTNRSSGKMGYAIAELAAKMGAEVTLVSGPTNLIPPKGLEFVSVQSAEQMYTAVTSRFVDQDIVIKAAAVADYRPKTIYNEKVKKKHGEWSIEMERTTDILKTLGEKKNKQFLVGFAAETENIEEYALNKLTNKNLDMIVANNIAQEGAGFNVDTNVVTLYYKTGQKDQLAKMSKRDVAKVILAGICNEIKGRSS